MPLRKRILKVTFKTEGANDQVLDQTLDLYVKIHKAALDPQSTCTIEVYNLTRTQRVHLLSQFTAFNKRAVKKGQETADGSTNPYVNVDVEAGYFDGATSSTSKIFSGQVVQVSQGSYPPNLSVRIECYTQQINRLAYTSGKPPENATFKEYVMWAGRQLKVTNTICETSMNESRNWNQFITVHTVGDLLIDIQNAYKSYNIAAYIDDNVLIVRDIDKIVSVSGRIDVNEFIGTPMWTEWGVEFQTLFKQNLTLTCAATLKSLMNPSLNREFVVLGIDYNLSSRNTPFYIKAYACPPASQ